MEVYPACAGIDLRRASAGRRDNSVYPACAGIDPARSSSSSIFLRLPRMRGDRPLFGQRARPPSWFTPHARGSTFASPFCNFFLSVYPHARGSTSEGSPFPPRLRFTPHARDRPCHCARRLLFLVFTPHARIDLGLSPTVLATTVYPACADRPSNSSSVLLKKFTLHARGSTA